MRSGARKVLQFGQSYFHLLLPKGIAVEFGTHCTMSYDIAPAAFFRKEDLLWQKETMNAKGFLADVKAGMDDAGLMEKYQLSGDLLQSAFEKIVDMGLLKRHDLEKRTLMSEKSIAIAWECPACGVPQTQSIR